MEIFDTIFERFVHIVQQWESGTLQQQKSERKSAEILTPTPCFFEVHNKKRTSASIGRDPQKYTDLPCISDFVEL